MRIVCSAALTFRLVVLCLFVGFLVGFVLADPPEAGPEPDNPDLPVVPRPTVSQSSAR